MQYCPLSSSGRNRDVDQRRAWRGVRFTPVISHAQDALGTDSQAKPEVRVAA